MEDLIKRYTNYGKYDAAEGYIKALEDIPLYQNKLRKVCSTHLALKLIKINPFLEDEMDFSNQFDEYIKTNTLCKGSDDFYAAIGHYLQHLEDEAERLKDFN